MSRNIKLFFFLTLFLSVFFINSDAESSKFLDSENTERAKAVYVPPGEHDEFYAFMSGGYSGNVTVYGLPSGRFIKTIPVFSLFPENGYGFSEETKDLLKTSWGYIPWGDAHHPQLSQTNGKIDGKWLFINENNTPRVARISLKNFETEEIIEIPNVSGNHASPFVSQNTEYLVAATRFSVPTPQKDMAINEKSYKENFKGVLSFVKVDDQGHMSVAFQIIVPGFDYDKTHLGKKKSHGWAFFSTYNVEQAHTIKERGASQRDKDYIAAVNWKYAEKLVAKGKGKKMKTSYLHNIVDEHDRVAKTTEIKQVTTLDANDYPGLVYYLPTPKSPHGVDVDPSGEYIVGGGKLSTIIPVHSFSKMLKAIKNKSFEGYEGKIPVLDYDKVIAGEVENPGLGPLHTEFDDKGYAYTSVYISSEVIKWKLGEWKVVDRIPVYYSIGHLLIPGGDTTKPFGKYLVALNKTTKDRYLPTGPELAHSAQLIDISGKKMKMLLDFPTAGEPHYAQAAPADLIKKDQDKIFDLAKNHNKYAIKDINDSRVERKGKDVHVYMGAIRTHFSPDNIEGIKVEDTVYFHITNLEQDWDVPHGFAIQGARNSELLVMPGDTRTLVWKPIREGVYPFYCTDFCSALHQEMQGYVRVSAESSKVKIKFNK